MPPRLLILETSCRAGQVALADGGRILGSRALDEARRHARDLVPAVRALLHEAGWPAKSLDGVIVSRGPGSYTGLRVGIMSAKTLAFASGCALLAVDTFAAVAHQAPGAVDHLAVLADAQQDRIYVQHFQRKEESFQAASALAILPLVPWLSGLEKTAWISGPGLADLHTRLPQERLVPPACWMPQAESLLHLGLERWQRGERDDFWTVEPLYLRPSAAEEKRPG